MQPAAATVQSFADGFVRQHLNNFRVYEASGTAILLQHHSARMIMDPSQSERVAPAACRPLDASGDAGMTI